MKYVLVSQGIKIYESNNKEEALKVMEIGNLAYVEYYWECIKNNEIPADNEIFLYEE